MLAKGGICYIGDLSSYKKDKLELLQSGNLPLLTNEGTELNKYANLRLVPQLMALKCGKNLYTVFNGSV